MSRRGGGTRLFGAPGAISKGFHVPTLAPTFQMKLSDLSLFVIDLFQVVSRCGCMGSWELGAVTAVDGLRGEGG
jgi:hypothetical protein